MHRSTCLRARVRFAPTHTHRIAQKRHLRPTRALRGFFSGSGAPFVQVLLLSKHSMASHLSNSPRSWVIRMQAPTSEAPDDAPERLKLVKRASMLFRETSPLDERFATDPFCIDTASELIVIDSSAIASGSESLREALSTPRPVPALFSDAYKTAKCRDARANTTDGAIGAFSERRT